MKKNTERFSNRVENYVKYRPGYPKEFIDSLFTSLSLSKDSIIADIGSGTGILTALLLDKGYRVVGVEPNKEMRKAAETLLEEYPKFVSIDGTAESTSLSNDSIDFIICAQAFHWFDLDACKSEFQRVLKPGCKVGLVWNKRIVQESGFSAAYENLVRTYANDYNEVNHSLITDTDFKAFFLNGIFEKTVFQNQQYHDFEGLKGRLLSSSYAPTLGEPNYEPMIIELKMLFDQYAEQGKVSFDYETESYIGEV